MVVDHEYTKSEGYSKDVNSVENTIDIIIVKNRRNKEDNMCNLFQLIFEKDYHLKYVKYI